MMLPTPLHPGSEPAGDPHAMRRLADELRAAARRAGALGSRTRTPKWRGASARAFAGQLKAAVSRADDTAAALLATARLLDQEADETAERKRAWRREMDEYEDRLRKARNHAAS